jgi:hypothetical protein
MISDLRPTGKSYILWSISILNIADQGMQRLGLWAGMDL